MSFIYVPTEVTVADLNPPYKTQAFANPLVPAANAYVRVTATGSFTLDPMSGPVDGAQARLWITSSGGAWTMTFAGAIVIPNASKYFASPEYTITDGGEVMVLLQYDSGLAATKLVSLVGDYL